MKEGQSAFFVILGIKKLILPTCYGQGYFTQGKVQKKKKKLTNVSFALTNWHLLGFSSSFESFPYWYQMGHWMDIVLQLVITALITGYCSGYVLDFSSFLQISTSSSLKQLLLLLGATSDRSSEVTIYLRDSIKMRNTPLFLLSQLCLPDRASTSLIYISRIFSIHKVTGIDENHACSKFF